MLAMLKNRMNMGTLIGIVEIFINKLILKIWFKKSVAKFEEIKKKSNKLNGMHNTIFSINGIIM